MLSADQQKFLKAQLQGISPAVQPAFAFAGQRLEQYARIAGADDATVRTYQSVCDALRRTAPRPAQFHGVYALEPGADLASESLIVGAGLGTAPEADELTGQPGSACVHLYTLENISTQLAIDNAYATLGVESFGEGTTSVRAIHTGPIDAYVHRARWRPAHSGISVAHHKVTAGTLGCHATRPDGSTLILSNNHVLANVNAAAIGDKVLQQAPFDGGRLRSDVLGLLEGFVTIDFAASNIVDCATALIDAADLSRDFIHGTPSGAAYYRVNLPSRAGSPGLRVGKSGRTTGLTSGYVAAVGVTVNVNMGGGRIARFDDQISIRGARGDFSQPGDSGSLIWSWDSLRNPVGLLFAGGGGVTFANPIDTVVNALGISLVV